MGFPLLVIHLLDGDFHPLAIMAEIFKHAFMELHHPF